MRVSEEKLLAGAYFDVDLSGSGIALSGGFTSVSGLGTEVDYEVYTEGGSNSPCYFFRGTKPRHLVLEQGVVTTLDRVSLLMRMITQGMTVPLSGSITLRDSFGASVRMWMIQDAHLIRYEGPRLDSNQVSMAVNRLEFLYSGCV